MLKITIKIKVEKGRGLKIKAKKCFQKFARILFLVDSKSKVLGIIYNQINKIGIFMEEGKVTVVFTIYFNKYLHPYSYFTLIITFY